VTKELERPGTQFDFVAVAYQATGVEAKLEWTKAVRERPLQRNFVILS
jgi:hypothetical protein